MTEKKPVSLKPSDFGSTINDFVFGAEKPPRLSSTEMDLLDFHDAGIAVVNEAFDYKPIRSMKKQELSRYVSHLALQRMVDNTTLISIVKDREIYRINKKNKPHEVRKFYDDLLDGTVNGYKPFVGAKTVRVWFWDDRDKKIAYSTMTEAGIPFSMLFVFVADILSEIGELGAITTDLQGEYKQGMRYLSWLGQAVKFIAEDVVKQ